MPFLRLPCLDGIYHRYCNQPAGGGRGVLASWLLIDQEYFEPKRCTEGDSLLLSVNLSQLHEANDHFLDTFQAPKTKSY